MAAVPSQGGYNPPVAMQVQVSEEDAQGILLVRAFEEADGDGRLLPYRLRKEATSQAAEGNREAVIDRARALLPTLDETVTSLPALRRVTRLAAGFTPLVFLLAFLLGLSTSALGPARQINLLSFPLLGLLAWNLTVYLVFFLVWILKGKSAGPPGKGLGTTVAPLVTLGYLRRAVRRIQAHEPETAAIVRRALSSYLTSWRPISAPLVQARARRMFHVGALAAMAGVLAGMYLRGLIFEYSVTWESTFLDEDGVRRLLGWALAPALTVLGRELPPLTGPAAPWIHLFGVSAGLLVLLPRGMLALSESLRVARLRRRLPLELTGAYFRKVLSTGRGDRLRVRILPYSRELPRRHGEKLQTALLDLFGSRAVLRLEDTLEYGAEASRGGPAETDDSLETVPVLVFNLAQTPEEEVHGELVESLTTRGGEAPLAVVDATSYRQRLGGTDGAPQRLEERRKAWSRTLSSTEARVCHVDLEEASTDELLTLLTASLEVERPS